MNKRVIGGVLIALLIAAVGVGYGAYRVKAAGDEQDRRARVIEQSRALDAAMEKIWDRMEASDQSWAETAGSAEVDPQVMQARAETDMEDLTKLVAEARGQIEGIPAEKVRAKYTAACDELDKMLEDSAADPPKEAAAVEAYKLLLAACDDDSKGALALRDSVRLCNKKKYSDAKAKADTAISAYKALKAKLVAAAKKDESGQVKLAYEYADGEIELAQMQRELALLGSRGSITRYNAQISKLEKQQTRVADTATKFDDAIDSVKLLTVGLHRDYITRAATAKSYWDDAKKIVVDGAF